MTMVIGEPKTKPLLIDSFNSVTKNRKKYILSTVELK